MNKFTWNPFFYQGFFCLGFPEVVYCHYSGDECHDAFITENLMDVGKWTTYIHNGGLYLLREYSFYFLGYITCKTEDLKLDSNGKDFLKSSLGTVKLPEVHYLLREKIFKT